MTKSLKMPVACLNKGIWMDGARRQPSESAATSAIRRWDERPNPSLSARLSKFLLARST